EHFFLVDGFVEEGHGAGGNGFFQEVRGLAAGDEDDGCVAGFFEPTEPVEDQEAIPLNAAGMGRFRREIDVENDEVRALAPDATDGGGDIHGGADFVAGGFEGDRNRFEDNNIVVRDEDLGDVRASRLAGGR